MTEESSPAIFVVSDGRGETGAEFLRAALVQFPNQPHSFHVRPGVRTRYEVETVVREAARRRAVIFYTLVSGETRSAIEESARLLLVPIVDVLGPAFSALHDLFQTEPEATPGLLYEMDKRRFDRMEAIDFTLKHDDGQRPADLGGADVVLVGVSRASKSTTCFYLAMEGLKAANVPLLPGVEPPPQLLSLDPRRVFGLTIEPQRLRSVRRYRAVNLGIAESDPYLDERRLQEEIRHANRLSKERGWRSVNVTYRAVEEIAREVTRLLASG